jgi:hypothetical protein
VFAHPGSRFVSLQYGQCEAEIERARREMGVTIHHWPDAIADYDETAALVSALDLVITVTTSVAHLAGGLGRPAWVLVNAAPRWCYGAEGERMPWYGSVRLFRQRRLGAWDDVMAAVVERLDEGASAMRDRDQGEGGAT